MTDHQILQWQDEKNELLMSKLLSGRVIYPGMLINACRDQNRCTLRVIQITPENLQRCLYICKNTKFKVNQSLRYIESFKQLQHKLSAVVCVSQMLNSKICENLFQFLNHNVKHFILLTGPPGTGKSLLAHSLGKVLEISQITINVSQIFKTSMQSFIINRAFVKLSNKNTAIEETCNEVEQLFRMAKQSSPSILIIDDLESIAQHRTNMTDLIERSAASKLLAELLLIQELNLPIFVIGIAKDIKDIGKSTILIYFF